MLCKPPVGRVESMRDVKALLLAMVFLIADMSAFASAEQVSTEEIEVEIDD